MKQAGLPLLLSIALWGGLSGCARQSHALTASDPFANPAAPAASKAMGPGAPGRARVAMAPEPNPAMMSAGWQQPQALAADPRTMSQPQMSQPQMDAAGGWQSRQHMTHPEHAMPGQPSMSPVIQPGAPSGSQVVTANAVDPFMAPAELSTGTIEPAAYQTARPLLDDEMPKEAPPFVDAAAEMPASAPAQSGDDWWNSKAVP